MNFSTEVGFGSLRMRKTDGEWAKQRCSVRTEQARRSFGAFDGASRLMRLHSDVEKREIAGPALDDSYS
jgi:hypothetical protein